MLRICAWRYFSLNSKEFMKRHVSDEFVQKSVAEGRRSRAYFKLDEVIEKYKLIKPNSQVVDLGSSPGGWSERISKILVPKLGKLISVDLTKMEPVSNGTFIMGDFRSPSIQQNISLVLGNLPASVIVSDMSPAISGIADKDHGESMEICHMILEFCCSKLPGTSLSVKHSCNLDSGGDLFMKYFNGGDEKEMVDEVSEYFQTVKRVKPLASRSESREMYLLARGFKGSDD